MGTLSEYYGDALLAVTNTLMREYASEILVMQFLFVANVSSICKSMFYQNRIFNTE